MKKSDVVPATKQSLKRLRELTAELQELEVRLRLGGGPDKIERQHSQGKLTARERIDRLLDKGSVTQEIGLLVAYDKYREPVGSRQKADGRKKDEEIGAAPGAGVVTVVGRVEYREVVVVANDATVKAGSWWPETIKKILRAQEIAMRSHVPIIYLVDSAGVNLPYQGGVFPGTIRRFANLLLQLDHAAVSEDSADRSRDGAVYCRRRILARALGRDRDGGGNLLHGSRRREPRERRHRTDD
jgi:acetyl-CoA carboxylase carboxyltransferase component